MKKWTLAEENFVIVNWSCMSARELTEALNEKFKTQRSKSSVDCKIDKLNLPKKREYRRNSGDNIETKLEIQGRLKTKELYEIKNRFGINQQIRIKTIETITKPVIRILEGLVIGKTESLVTVQKGRYKESFAYIDFYTRRAVVL